jgi:uncharacterized membrane protein YfcA
VLFRSTPADIGGGRPHPILGVFWGSLAGFMSLLVNVGAPPYQIHILPQRLDKLTLVGTTTIFFAFMNEINTVSLSDNNHFTFRNLPSYSTGLIK